MVRTYVFCEFSARKRERYEERRSSPAGRGRRSGKRIKRALTLVCTPLDRKLLSCFPTPIPIDGWPAGSQPVESRVLPKPQTDRDGGLAEDNAPTRPGINRAAGGSKGGQHRWNLTFRRGTGHLREGKLARRGEFHGRLCWPNWPALPSPRAKSYRGPVRASYQATV